MKKLVVVLLITFGCTKEEVASQINFGDAITAEYSKSVFLKNDFSIKINTLEDSRCPKGVNCIVEGFVKLGFDFSDKTSSKELKIEYSSKINKINFELNSQKYELEILDVSPLREASTVPDLKNYKVNFIVRKI